RSTGRTGRAGRMGTAISLVSPTAIGDLYYLRLKYKIHPLERQLPTRQELQTREETDVVASLSLKYASPDPNHPYRAIARRLLTHDDAEAIVAGVLESILGNKPEAVERGARERQAQRPAPVKRATARQSNERRTRSETTSGREMFKARPPRAPRPERSEERRGHADVDGYDDELGIGYQVSEADDSAPNRAVAKEANVSSGSEGGAPARRARPARVRDDRGTNDRSPAKDTSSDVLPADTASGAAYVSL